MFTSVLAGGDKRRIDELYECTKILGIPEANVTIIMWVFDKILFAFKNYSYISLKEYHKSFNCIFNAKYICLIFWNLNNFI